VKSATEVDEEDDEEEPELGENGEPDEDEEDEEEDEDDEPAVKTKVITGSEPKTSAAEATTEKLDDEDEED
jgi:hypothetical protein